MSDNKTPLSETETGYRLLDSMVLKFAELGPGYSSLVRDQMKSDLKIAYERIAEATRHVEASDNLYRRMAAEQNILQRQVEVLISKLVDEGDCDVCPCEIEVCHHDPEACKTMIRQWSRSEAEQNNKTGG